MTVSNRSMRLHDHCMRVCGANFAERVAGAVHFKQACAAGVLQADEFGFMLEHNPYFIGVLAREFGVTHGNMRSIAREGRITGEAMVLALHKHAGMIESDSGCVPISYAEAAAKSKLLDRAGYLMRERLIELVGDDQGI